MQADAARLRGDANNQSCKAANDRSEQRATDSEWAPQLQTTSYTPTIKAPQLWLCNAEHDGGFSLMQLKEAQSAKSLSTFADVMEDRNSTADLAGQMPWHARYCQKRVHSWTVDILP